ncbi:EamA family transporter [Actinomadura viridis]|uniref:DME family drug/metabolite transporter n=1 Tax=Actinomadura viridis TaxID=58110 RepID=A0A931DM74_9ACTN|nr:EamA family transporter [Actinomadura viridis]MBG6090166.1 DME family drug/metabolite transporter [Actinomadura viridis]
MDQRNEYPGALLILAAGVLWGTVGPAQVLAASPAPPITLGAARILSGGVLLALFVLAVAPRAFRVLSRATWRPLLAASAATGTFQAAFLTAVDRTGAAVATAVVFGLAPVFTGLCEGLVLRARPGRRWLAGTVCAVAGCALLMAPGHGGTADPSGVGLGLVAGCCFGVYTVAAKRLVATGSGAEPQAGAAGRPPVPPVPPGLSMAAAVAISLLAGGTLLLPWAAAGLPDLAGTRSLALVAWLGPVTTAAAYMFFVSGLRRVTAATAGTLSLAEPLVAAVLALAVLGERLSPAAAAGAVLLLGGLAVVAVPAPAAGRLGVVRRPRSPARAEGGPVCWSGATGAVKVDSTTGERS